jgi:LacI family transcriptional regulator, gluconate utilization system Gnt-I transcriptional repressor
MAPKPPKSTAAAGASPPSNGNQIARMKDVARLAGVTTMTVSRALRTPEKVSEETRLKVEEAVRRVGFIPNYAARSLVSQRSQVVVALFPTMMNSVFSGTIEELSRELALSGYHLLLGGTDFDIDQEEKLLSGFIGWRPAGIVVTGSVHTVATRHMLENANAPVTELWSLPKKPFDVAVGFSNHDATYQMTMSLHSWGYRRIGFLYVDYPRNDRAVDRKAGYRAALRDLGLTSRPEMIVPLPFEIEAGRAGLRRILEADPDADAVMCGSDTLAVGALMEALRLGLRVPQDIAISGFGDVELARELVPALTTVRIPRAEIGRRSAQIILQRIAGTYEGPSVVDCGFSIIRRESA